MAGIYIHIPFCRKACVYCDFHFITSLKQQERMVHAIQEEIIQRKAFFQEHALLTVLLIAGDSFHSISSRSYRAESMGKSFPIIDIVRIILDIYG